MCNLLTAFQVVTHADPTDNLMTYVGEMRVKLRLPFTSFKVVVLFDGDVKHSVYLR